MAIQEEVAKIRQLISKIADSSSDQVLGSRLGAAIAIEFPALNMRLEFNGLKTFIQQHCSDLLVWRGKHGGDDVYARPSPTEPIEGLVKSQLTAEAGDTLTAWGGFSNPNSFAEVVVEPSIGTLRTLKLGDPVPEGFVRIPKLTTGDFKLMAVEYLKVMPHEDAEQLTPLAVHDPFSWLDWSNALKRHRGGSFFREWLKWRFDRICSLFADRLRQTGIESDDVVARLVDELRNSKPAPARRRAPIQPMQHPRVAGADSTAEAPRVAQQAHALAQMVIACMREDEIRRLWLPFGAILDALGQLRHDRR